MTDHKDEAERVTFHITCSPADAPLVKARVEDLLDKDRPEPIRLVCTIGRERYAGDEHVMFSLECNGKSADAMTTQLRVLMISHGLDPDDLVCTVAGDEPDICGACVCPAAVDVLQAKVAELEMRNAELEDELAGIRRKLNDIVKALAGKGGA